MAPLVIVLLFECLYIWSRVGIEIQQLITKQQSQKTWLLKSRRKASETWKPSFRSTQTHLCLYQLKILLLGMLIIQNLLWRLTFNLASMIFVRVRQSPWKPLQPMTVVSVLWGNEGIHFYETVPFLNSLLFLINCSYRHFLPSMEQLSSISNL